MIKRTMVDQRGQVAVLVALMATVLASTLVLAVDAGVAYQGRRVLQTSVDAASLAGAMDIAEGRSSELAKNTIEDYINSNLKGPVGAVNVTFPSSEEVTVEAKMEKDTFFARVFKQEKMTVGAKATARIGVAGKVSNLVPIVVPLSSVVGHIGESNQAVYELGEDHPLESLSITYKQAGSQVVYTVAYVNTRNNAVDLVLRSPIPIGAEYIGDSATGGGLLEGSEVKWQWPDIAPGDRRTATFAVNFSAGVNSKNEVFAQTNGEQLQTASTETSQRGFFWLVNFDSGSNGTPDFADWIRKGYPDLIGVGHEANGVGVRSSLKSALSERIIDDPAVVLPLFNFTEGGGSGGNYSIAGFAEFVITGFNLDGRPKTVSGYFTEGTVTTGVAGDQDAVDMGVKVVWLSE